MTKTTTRTKPDHQETLQTLCPTCRKLSQPLVTELLHERLVRACLDDVLVEVRAQLLAFRPASALEILNRVLGEEHPTNAQG